MKKTQKKHIQVKNKKVLTFVALLCVVCTLISATGCRYVTEVVNRQEVVEHKIVITQADKSGLPDYVADLVKLDEVFRAYSYDGYDEELFGEMLLKYSLGFSRQEHWSGLPLPSPMHESEK